MDSRTDRSVADDEVARFLADNPDIVGLDVLLPDGNGVMRGKRIPRDGIDKIYRDGVRFPGSLYALDITGADVVEAGLVWERGDADYIGWPVPGSLKRAPWHARPLGQALLSMYDESGAPFFLDPRHVLKRVLDRYSADGLTPVVAIELEFYLIDRELDSDGRPQPPRSPHTGRRESTVQPLIMTSLDDFETFFARVEQATDAQDIPAEAAISEAGPGQYEINLQYNANAMAAADQGVLLKHLVKGVAASCGFEATFMAKPYAEESGNGLHIHMSLLDRDGRNVFDDGTARGSDAMRHAIGGLQATTAEALAICAPNANSYRRFQEGSYAPTSTAWAYNNRTTGLRIPSSGGKARRIEHRFAGADANIYLATAAMLAGAHHGVVNKVRPDEPTDGNAYTHPRAMLPTNWNDAIRAFDAASVLPDYLGADFCNVFSLGRKAERRKFRSVVSPLEYEWYLRTV
ncbi:MAG: glutamine synthetase family protein [Dongiaceae bacterium]